MRISDWSSDVCSSDLLAELFESRFDPAHDRPDAGKVEPARQALASALESILPPEQRAAAATLIEQVSYARGLDRDAQIDACHDAPIGRARGRERCCHDV